MVGVVQVGHGLEGHHEGGVELAALWRMDETELQLATSANNIVKNLLDCVAVLAGPAGDHAAKIGFDGAQEGGGHGAVAEFGVIGEEFSQVVVVEIGATAPITGPPFREILPK